MKCRAVKKTDSNDILTIGRNEDQGGQDYNGVGTWLDFTFDIIPTMSMEVSDYISDNPGKNAYKLVSNSIMIKTLSELEAE